MDATDVKALLGEAIVTLLSASLIALAAYWVGRTEGRSVERAVWQNRLLVAERAARKTETDLAEIAARGAARIAEKERLLNERVKRLDEEWRALLASLPRCRLPAAVGVHLNAAGGMSSTATVAGGAAGGADDPARAADDLGPFIELADTLRTVRDNYERCAVNIERLEEAERRYNEIRNRVNAGRG